MSTTPSIAKLSRVSLREVWPHEAYDFTQWLQTNIEALNEALELSLSEVDREEAVGTFSVDLVAKDDDSGKTVIIENQLGRSDHDHLGKLLTYVSGMEAQAAVWIVGDPRPEHAAAINWLNQSTSAEFYLVKVEAVKIGDSPAAPLFTRVMGPSEEARRVARAARDVAESQILLKRWWTTLIERSARVTKLHADVTPSDVSWIAVTAGVPGVRFNYSVTRDTRTVELYIDRGKERGRENELIFDLLLVKKPEIEESFGAPLEWQRHDGLRKCVVQFTLRDGGYRAPEEQWPGLQDSLIELMGRLESAMRPRLRELKVGELTTAAAAG